MLKTKQNQKGEILVVTAVVMFFAAFVFGAVTVEAIKDVEQTTETVK